jgi:hypothetical protein
MKVKYERCILVIFFAVRGILGGYFVFGETKRPAEADLFVVPQLALRLNLIEMSGRPCLVLASSSAFLGLYMFAVDLA